MVKRITAFICALCMFVVFCGCEVKQECASPKDAAARLSDWLDGEGLVATFGYDEFDEFADKYKVNGVPLSECTDVMFADGIGGGTTSHYGEGFVYNISTWTDQDTGYIDHTNEIYTAIPLENLVLPLEVELGDTVSQLLSKLGAESDAISGVESSAETTLYSDDIHTLIAYNLLLSSESSSPAYAYEIVFTETTKSSLSDGRPATVTRSVEFIFKNSEDAPVLSHFQFGINENYPLEEVK